jgi:hypothetical protein
VRPPAADDHRTAGCPWMPLDAALLSAPTHRGTCQEKRDPNTEGAEARPRNHSHHCQRSETRQKNCQTAWRGAPVGIVQLRNTREQFLPMLVRPESAEPPLREPFVSGLRNRGSNHAGKYRRRRRGCQAARFRLTPPRQEREPGHLGGARRAGLPRGGGISMRFGQPLRPIHLPGESGLVAFPVPVSRRVSRPTPW